jgi:hypothetical protein
MPLRDKDFKRGEVSHVRFGRTVKASVAIAKGDLVYIDSWDETSKAWKVNKADANVSSARAQYIAEEAISSGALGKVYRALRRNGLNTGGSTVGNPVYLSATAGGWTLTKPTAGRAQIVGRVAVVNASTGEIEFDLIDADDGGDRIAGSDVNDVAEGDVVGGIPVVHIIDVPDGSTGDVDVTLTHKTRVLDVLVIKVAAAGGASDTLTVKNGANAITNAISINIADKTTARAGEIDDAQWDIAAAGTLRATRTKASAANVACKVVVTGVRVA